MLPFEGIRVLDFTRVVSGPFCTQNLGLLGAEIIKIEEREGGDSTRVTTIGVPELKPDGFTSSFVMYNAGKKSITLDLKHPGARDVIMKLARSCDVVVENFRAGVIKRLGFDYETLKQENPQIIFCSISGFGQSGPDAKAPAFDGNIQASSGMMAMTGEPGGNPMKAGFTVCDISTGLYATLAIAAALYQRKNTGQGQYIDVAMLDSAMWIGSQTASAWLNGGVVQPRRGNLAINFEPTADVYRTADGTINLGIIRTPHVMLLLDELGLTQYKDDPRFANRVARIENTAWIRGLVQAELLKASSVEWKRRLDDVGVPCSRILEIPEVFTQPQVKHREMVEEITDDRTGKPVRILNMPFKFGHDGPRKPTLPPRLGAHTREVLQGLGYGEGEIQALKAGKVI